MLEVKNPVRKRVLGSFLSSCAKEVKAKCPTYERECESASDRAPDKSLYQAKLTPFLTVMRPIAGDAPWM